MCGFGIDLIFKVAIFVIVVLVIFALLSRVFPWIFAGGLAGPYSDIILYRHRRRGRNPHSRIHLEASRMCWSHGWTSW